MLGVVPGAVYLLLFYMADLYGDNLRRDKLLMKLEIKTITKYLNQEGHTDVEN